MDGGWLGQYWGMLWDWLFIWDRGSEQFMSGVFK